MEKDIIILAKSYKHSPNYCIAGIDINTGEWIRPISNNSLTEGAVPPQDIKYSDGGEANVLDVVKIKFIKRVPTAEQPENYLYDPKSYWQKLRTGSLEEIIQARGFDNCTTVFSNTYNRISESELPGKSLLLLKIQRPSILVDRFYERKKISLNFNYNNMKYKWFQVSDIVVESCFNQKDYGNYLLGTEKIAVFSLTGKYKDNYYKMLAQLFNTI